MRRLVDVGGFDRVDGAAVPGDYVRWMAHQRRHGPDVAMAELGVGRSDRVLDLGCGTGADLASLAIRAGHVVGLDRSLSMAQKAQSCVAVNIGSVVNADGHRLPFRGGCFDACWVRAVLIHADDPRQVLDEVVRVVRPEGRCGGRRRVCRRDHRKRCGPLPRLARQLRSTGRLRVRGDGMLRLGDGARDNRGPARSRPAR